MKYISYRCIQFAWLKQMRSLLLQKSLKRHNYYTISVIYMIGVCHSTKYRDPMRVNQKYWGMFKTYSLENHDDLGKKKKSQRRDKVFKGVSVPCQHATFMANALWKPINGKGLTSVTDHVSLTKWFKVKRKSYMGNLVTRRWSWYLLYGL